jgi:ParB family chromosome partitioning protein
MIPTSQLKATLTEDAPDEDLVASIQENGILLPLVIRDTFQVLDGRERFKVAKLLGLAEVPCRILYASDEDLVTMNLIQSVHRVKVKPVEYARQLKRLADQLPRAELAQKINKSEQWIAYRLSLLNLSPEFAEMVDEMKMTLKRAFALAKLSHEEQKREFTNGGDPRPDAEQPGSEDN